MAVGPLPLERVGASHTSLQEGDLLQLSHQKLLYSLQSCATPPKRSLWKNLLHAEVTYILLKRSAYCPRSPLSSRVWKAGLKQQFQLAGTCTICTLYNYHVKKGRFKLRLNRWGGRGRVQLECTGMHLCQGRHILLHRGGTTDREPSETLVTLRAADHSQTAAFRGIC